MKKLLHLLTAVALATGLSCGGVGCAIHNDEESGSSGNCSAKAAPLLQTQPWILWS